MTLNKVYNIPSGFSFVDALAQGLMDIADGDVLTLSQMKVLLPTRRACRSLREAFLRISKGRPLLLPAMHPIGDVDEDELSIYIATDSSDAELSLPPAIPAIQRQFLLAKLISARGHGHGVVQDMALAKELARLMDQTYTEDLDLKDLPKLVEGSSFADHWQISIEFLSLISEHWPKILSDMGMIDAKNRSNILLKKLCQHWQKNPPKHPVIAAGSTGSIPTTALLLKTVAEMDGGMVILPGLDQIIDNKSWDIIDDTHPQFTLKNLLSEMGVERSHVKTWDVCKQNFDQKQNIRHFISEIMRPAETTQEWQTIKERLSPHPDEFSIEWYDCANPQEEALTIALALRRSLEDKQKVAALVTPDRNLARRVAMACRRWNIEIDDSAGKMLSETNIGTYLRLCVEVAKSNVKPIALLDFCKHTLCRPNYTNWRSCIRYLDQYILRGANFESGLDGYIKKIGLLNDNNKTSEETLSFIQNGYQSFQNGEEKRPFCSWLKTHIKTAEYFCTPDILWAGQEGESASIFLSNLSAHLEYFEAITLDEYLLILTSLMKDVSVRPKFGLHPRLMILGQLEARLLEADIMILSGLNEGTWPQKIGVDPWMSRPMRKDFGLPPHERSIGLAAHDFAQSLCANQVILTRSLRVDGTPTVPSRWLQRMNTVTKACGFDQSIFQNQKPLLAIAKELDISKETIPPLRRPEPRPPVSARPRELSVTKVETWLHDPYSIYARYILKFRPLDDLEQELNAALRGTLIHDALKEFFVLYKTSLPQDIAAAFTNLSIAQMDKAGIEPHVKAMWIPKIQKIGEWFANKEIEMRKSFLPTLSEEAGKIQLQGKYEPFTLTCRVDRVDVSKDGLNAAIIDYKSGGNFTKTGIEKGRFPQLPLEALILQDGEFENHKSISSSVLAYWIINGSKEGGKIVELNSPENVAAAIENAKQGLIDLIIAFDEEEKPYMSLPRLHKAPKYNDYEHLARVKEWTALDDAADDFATGEGAL